MAAFRQVIIALKMVSNLGYTLWSQLRTPLISEGAVWTPVIWYNTQQLLKDVTGWAQIPVEVAESILADLTFDPDALSRDLEVSPLISRQGQTWIPPHILQSYRWEDNLSRLWSTKYFNEYTSKVGQFKKLLASEVRSAFLGKDFVVSSTDRPIKDGTGKVLTDVDLAVAAPSEGILLLLETKWPISPANWKETDKTDTEVQKGFEQLYIAQQHLLTNPDSISKLFGDQGVKSSDVSEIHCVQLVRGLYPSASVAMTFPLVPADAAIDYLYETSETKLGAITRDLEEAPEKRLLAGLRFYDVALTLAGYEVVLPLWTWETVLREFSEEMEFSPGRNSGCPCGSSKKFKKCCGLATRSKRYTPKRIVSGVVPFMDR